MDTNMPEKWFLDGIDPFILSWMLNTYALTVDDDDNAKRPSLSTIIGSKIIDFYIQIVLEP